MKRTLASLLLCLATLAPLAPATAATYRVGDTVTNFTLTARHAFTRSDGTAVPAGAPVQLHDFAGSIVFLEWFAVWCPYCVAAAPQVETGIVDWYQSRHGNPAGIPVVHVAVNQEPASFYQDATSNFIRQQGFGLTVNDYDRTGTNRVRFSFQPSGQPIFVVINGVTNSSTHRPWQLLVNHQGYGDTDFNLELASFRTKIDAVQTAAPAPVLRDARATPQGFQFTVQTQPQRTYRIEASTDLDTWLTVATLPGSTTPMIYRETNSVPTRRFYRAVTP